MKIRKNITKILTILIICFLTVITVLSYAADNRQLRLEYFRYVNNKSTNGYALGTQTGEGQSYHPIYQILDESQNTNYYCLNATEGVTWNNPTAGTSSAVQYNKSYNLDNSSDIKALSGETNKAYKAIGDSQNLKQILWILDNIYIPTKNTEIDTAKRHALMQKAGFTYDQADDTKATSEDNKCYAYKSTKYKDKVSQDGKKGYFYYDEQDKFQSVEIEDDLIEVAQQAALWYFTNYKENNGGDVSTFDVSQMQLKLKCSKDNQDKNSKNWPDLGGEEFKVTGYGGEKFKIGEWKEEQARILCSYLIDSAESYASSTQDSNAGNPVTLSDTNSNLKVKNVQGTECFVVGPLKIEQQREAVYDLSDTIKVNGNANNEAYISDEGGNRKNSTRVSDFIGTDFYVAVPTSQVSENTIKIGFSGKYSKNEKKLWICTNKGEQPIVEVTPKNQEFELSTLAEIIEIDVTKQWEDKNDQDQKRPQSISVTLKNQGTTVKTATLEQSNGWEYKFTKLPKMDNGSVINYTVEENDVPSDYTSATSGSMGEGFIITNSYTPEEIQIPVQKIWNDAENQDGKRLASITAQLKKGDKVVQTKVLSDANGWKDTFTGLAKYENGSEITYTVEEKENISGYLAEVTGNKTEGFKITNSYTPEKINIPVKKIWNDKNDQDRKRPESITVRLKKGDQVVQEKELNNGNGWQETFTDLDKYEKVGQLINYTVEEVTLPEGYTSVVAKDDTKGFTITNSYTPETTQVSVTKIWNDKNNRDNVRPSSITLILKADGVELTRQEIQAKEDNTWEYTFQNLNKYKDGNEIIYTVDEVEVPKYEKSITGSKETGYEITNTYKVFDLALRKSIEKITDKEGNDKTIQNENTEDASRNVTYVAEDILTKGTATYNHRKDPIVVEKGDIITYNITVYNEGDAAGYPETIVDKLPEGMALKGYKKENITEGTYENGNVKYTYIYNPETNEITFTNVNKNAIPAYKETLSSETVQIECEINQKPSMTQNTYLTNIAYITKEYNEEKEEEVTIEVDSDPNKNPSAPQKKIEDKYTGYHGGDNHNGESDKDVYTDGTEDNNDYFPGQEDDDDFEVVVVEPKIVDLALTKFIIAVSKDLNIEDGEYLTADGTEGSKENPYTRATSVNTTELKNNPGCYDATYTLVKTPIVLPEETYVLYNIRVYNEGETDVYAGKITDYLPANLDFVECPFNTNYGWNVENNGKTIWTEYLSHTNETDQLIKAFDRASDDEHGSGLYYKDVPVLCRVNKETPNEARLVNSAEITEYEDENGNVIPEDEDSEPENLEEKNKEKREEDDDDYEVIEAKRKRTDLALSKFVAAVSQDLNIEDGEYLTADGKVGSKENPYTRATSVNTTELKNNPECHDATYNIVKDPAVTIPAKSYILYNIRVYNEGETDAYAGKVTDHLPDYLDYVDCDFNKNYGWNVEQDGKTIWTEYLSHTNGTDKLIKAFDKETDDGAGSGLSYKDIQVLCKVNDNAPTGKNLVNVAEITEYEDEDGDPVPEDEDSTPDNVDEKNEDDDDHEQIIIKTFDLSLKKYISTVYVTEDGKTTTTQTGNTGDESKDTIPKVEINRKKINSTVVKFGYTIKVTNEGDISGYAKEITDYVPQGLKFYAEDNKGWTDEGNNVISTRLLENTLLQPGESATVTVIFRWINGSENLGLKTNTAEISEDYNEEGIPDKDSTPDNKDPKEDDYDEAKVLLSVATGLGIYIIKYVTVGLVILGVLGTGIITIKKFVL